MRYVVGYTDTPAGHDALALGERLARRPNATLDVVLVIPDLPAGLTPPDATYDRYVDAQARQWLRRAEAAIDPALTARLTLVRSDSAPAALLAALEPDARLLVVGAKRNPLGQISPGAVSGSLLHTCTRPIAVAPEGTQVALRKEPVTRVTCFLGTRPGRRHLIEEAIDVARRRSAPLRIVSLVTLDRLRADADVDGAVAAAAARAEEELDTPVTTITGAGSSIEDAVRATDWEPTELALVGSSRLAQPRRLFLGSTATKVMRVLPVPLVVVPSRKPGDGTQEEEQ